jgi:hypothetical protein
MTVPWGTQCSSIVAFNPRYILILTLFLSIQVLACVHLSAQHIAPISYGLLVCHNSVLHAKA